MDAHFENKYLTMMCLANKKIKKKNNNIRNNNTTKSKNNLHEHFLRSTVCYFK